MSPKVQRPHMRRVVVMRGDLGGILVQLAVTWRRPKIRFEPAVDQINMAVGRSKEHVHDVLRLPASLVDPPQLDVLQQPEAALPPQLRDDARPDRCRLLQHQPPQRVEPPKALRLCTSSSMSSSTYLLPSWRRSGFMSPRFRRAK